MARIGLLGFVWLACTSALPAQPAGKEPTVVRIVLKTDANLQANQFRNQVVQKVGEPLDSGKVNESLKRLFATGRFVSLEADTAAQPDGVELIFLGKAQYFVGAVEVRGNPSPLNSSTLVAAARLTLGQPVNDRDLETAKNNLKNVLADSAFYKAKIDHKLIRNPQTQEADVVFTIDPDDPAELSEVVFQGQPAFPGATLRTVTGWHPGDQLTSPNITKGLFKVRNFYLKHGYLQANTLITKRIFDPKKNTEKLFVEADAGPVIQARVRGVSISQSKLRNILPVYQDGVVDDASLKLGAEALQDYYQRRGFFYTSVKAEPLGHPKPQHILITYRVERGTEGVFEGYQFEGNRSIPDATLASAMTLQPAAFLQGSGTFSDKMLAADIDSLKGLYQAKGYLDAKITPRLNYDYQNRSNHLFVTLVIQEGTQTLVGTLTLKGLSTEQKNLLWARLANKPGQPYSPQNVQNDRNGILRYFLNHGYNQARVEATATAGSTKNTMNVEYQAVEGRKETIARIIFLGNQHTRDGIIRRELSIHPGDPVNESEILDSQRRLYGLGLFNEVQIAPQNPASDETQKTLLVQTEETRRWTLGYGFGAEVQRLGSNEPQGQVKASPRVSVDVTRLNVGGRNQTLTFQGRFSSLDKGGSASYFIPRFPSRQDISMRLDVLAENSANVLTFTAKREEASILVEKRYSNSTFISARYSFRNVQALNLSNRISANEIPLESRPARIGMYAMSYVNDHRNDPLDPTRGSYSLVDAGVAWTGLGSQSNFLRLAAQNSTYYRLGRHFIFARNTRIAIESPYGGLLHVVVTGPNGEPETILTHDIPLPERLFMGGSDSHRGFSINQAGPRDPQTGFPIGGNALFLNSLELRRPFANGRFGVILFHDAGNVYSSVREMRLFKVHQSSPTDFNYTVHAVGLGLLYRTPVGPLRVDLGYAINPPRFQVAIPGGTEVRQLSHYQYFLSIGQSF